jgi:hypothetical protein
MKPRSVLHFLLVFTLLFPFGPVSAKEKKETVLSVPSASSSKDGEVNAMAGQNKEAVKAGPAEDPVQPFLDDSGKDTKTENEKTLETVNPELFDKGYRAFSRNNVEKAASLLYEYVSKNSFTADDYDWAEFFLGVSLKKSGFTHAAADTLSRVITRKPDVQIVNYALEIFEEITRTLPYDRDLVVLRSICDQEFGFVDDKLNDFIHYHQGVFDWENGFDDWGSEHFRQIRKETYYHYEFLFQKALYDVSRNRIDAAIETLKIIEAGSFDGEALKNDVRKTLARLLYEKKDYPAADSLYLKISDNIVYQAQNLLERSWVQYRMNQPEKAMGLLYAFKAPVYSNYFTPEYFLLKSFIYKDVCRYQRALGVIDEFRNHYRDALENIYGRKDFTENKPLLLALLGQKKIDDAWRFMRLVEKEQSQVKKVKDPLLKAWLEKIYALEMEKASRDFRLLMRDRFEILANELLEYEEKTDLMAYEVGLDMYQRVYQFHYRKEEDKEKVKKQVAKHYYAIYPFQGEFWTDELNTYKVVLEDKCACMEEWDIFFK